MSELVGGIPSDPALTGLPVPVLTEDTGLRDALTRITLFGHQAVAGCAAVSITLIECGCAVTMGSSSDVAVKLDDVQYGDGDGPCLTAAREQRVIRVDDRAIDPRWPHYSQVSEQLGIRSSLSLPLILGNDQLHGGFNVYGTTASAFGADDVELSATFADQATAIVLNAQASAVWKDGPQVHRRQVAAAHERDAAYHERMADLLRKQLDPESADRHAAVARAAHVAALAQHRRADGNG